MEWYGYRGRDIWIDLTEGKVEVREGNIKFYEDFLGGMGVHLRILWDILPPKIDPLSPENPIIIGAGPLVGTGAPGATRLIGTTKYPETGSIGCAAGAMKFGFMLKLAGYDNIIIKGRSEKPVT